MKIISFISFAALLVSVGCSSETAPKGYKFASTGGNMTLIIDIDNMKYFYREIDQSNFIENIIKDCSNSENYCLDGPFYMSIRRSDIARLKKDGREIWIKSENIDKRCELLFDLTKDKGALLRAFDCKYKNGAPWPGFVAVNRYMPVIFSALRPVDEVGVI